MKQFLKRYAFAISILICVVFYLLFLTLAFSEKKETYICYTTKTGECYHAYYCSYLKYSSYPTTVYQAEKKKYRACSKCNPFQERFKTTITIRNYLAPALISIPISTLIYIGLTKEKKDNL